MESNLRQHFNELSSKNDKLRFEAVQTILKITNEKVDWIYEIWDDLILKLEDENSFQRSIAIMILCNLAKSDRENRINNSIDRLLTHTRDEKFITSRQCIQNIWKVAAANQGMKTIIFAHLEEQYKGCTRDKHYNLIRQDIIQSLKNLYEIEKNAIILEKAQELVQMEEDEKYRKKLIGILG